MLLSYGREQMAKVFQVPFSGQEIGQGFDSDTHLNVGTALSVHDVSEDKAADGQIVTTSFDHVSSQDKLLETMGVDVSLNGRYGLFSGGAKVDFSQSHSVNSFSSFITGRMQVQNAIRHGHGFKLTDEVAPLVTANRMDEFKNGFGDMFVRALYTGGEFCVIARVTSVSEETQTNLAVQLSFAYNGLVASADLKAAISTATSDAHEKTDVTVWTSQIGGQGHQASFTGPEAADIIARLKEFPESVHEHGVGFVAEVASYDTIAMPIPTAEENEDRDVVLNDCNSQKMDFLKKLSDIDFALEDDARGFFDDLPSSDDLLAIRNKYRATLNSLMAHAIKIATGKMNPPQLFVAEPSPPALTFKKKATAPVQRVKVPKFVGMQGKEAVKFAGILGLKVQLSLKDIVFGPGEQPDPETLLVIEQFPEPDTQVPLGTNIGCFC
jgi:hypothetical protein